MSRFLDGRQLEFVRTATPEDKDAPKGGSRWRDPSTGDEGWLEPKDVMTFGLTDRMREGVSAEIAEMEQGPVVATVSQDEDTSPSLPAAPPGPSMQVLGGHTDVWRWERVDDAEFGVIWAISNKPAIEAWQKAGDNSVPCPQLQYCAVPEFVIHAIAQGASYPTS